MDDFSKMTNDQIKLYAKENGIDISGAKNKSELIAKVSGLKNVKISEKNENVVESNTIETKNPESSTLSNNDNVVSSRQPEKSFQKIIIENDKNNKVALYSEKNLHWSDVGHIKIGYNIVTKEASEKWLKKSGIRKATPEEVATYYGL